MIKGLATAVLAVSLMASPLMAAPTATTPKVQSQLAVRAFPLPVPQDLAAHITEAASKYGVDPNLIAAVAFKESRYRPNAVSRIGAEGVMQLKPRTARWLGVKDSFDARQNVLGGTKYLRMLLDRFDGDLDMALAGYNAGPDLVAKVGPRATEEAIEYVATVKRYYKSATRAS